VLADHVADRLIDPRNKVEMAEKVAPTRPHPGVPNSEMFHRVVGPGVGKSTAFAMRRLDA
jgi:hypothetical protein